MKSYYSSSYKRAKTTDDSCIKLNNGTYGKIYLIMEFQSSLYLIINIYEPVNANIVGINKDSDLKIFNLVPLTNILEKCITRIYE